MMEVERNSNSEAQERGNGSKLPMPTHRKRQSQARSGLGKTSSHLPRGTLRVYLLLALLSSLAHALLRHASLSTLELLAFG